MMLTAKFKSLKPRKVDDVRTSFPMRAINGGFTKDKGNVVDYCCL